MKELSDDNHSRCFGTILITFPLLSTSMSDSKRLKTIATMTINLADLMTVRSEKKWKGLYWEELPPNDTLFVCVHKWVLKRFTTYDGLSQKL
eukprot:6439459-Amphidinium_carterae.1